MSAKHTPGPYHAEFGAIRDEISAGFLFTVDPPKHAEVVASALNAGELLPELLAALKRLTDEVGAEFTVDGHWSNNGQLVSRAAYAAARKAIALAEPA